MAVKEKKATKQEAAGVTPSSTEKHLRIKLVRSVIGFPRYQREVVKGLGLRKMNSEVVRTDSPEVWGMIRKIPHLLKVEAIEKQ